MNMPVTLKDKAPRQKRPRIQTTLLDLVQAVHEITDNDQQVTAVVAHLVNTGQTYLLGDFKGRRVVIG